MPRTRRSPQLLFALLTALLAVVVMLIIAVPRQPRFDENERWTRFRRTEVEPPSAVTPPAPAPGALAAESIVPGTSWRISAVRRSALGTHTHHVQVVAGRPVLGSWAVGHTLRSGRRIVEGRASRLPGADESAGDSLRSRQAALAIVGVTELRGEVQTVPAWTPSEDGLRAVHVVTIPSRIPIGDFRVVIDEETSAVLSVDDLLTWSDGTGWVFTTVPGVPCGVTLPVDDALLQPFVSEEPLRELEGTGYLDGAHVRVLNGTGERVHAPDGAFRYPPSNPGFEQVMAYRTITEYYSRIASLGIDGYAPHRIVVDARGYAGDNSFFSPATGRITYGVGGVPDAQDPELILHELGHALHHYAQPEYATTQASRAVSEGIADYLACSTFDDPLLAEWDAAAYSHACPPYLRRLDIVRRYPDSLTGEPHADGLILASALWAIRARIGSDVADRVLLESLFFLRPDSDIAHAASVFTETAALLGETDHLGVIDDLFRDRGLVAGHGGAQSTPQPVIRARASPNPFAAGTAIRYALPFSGEVEVRIVDARGRLVRSLHSGRQDAGSHALRWDGTDTNGRDVAAGVYLYEIVAGGGTRASGKIVCAR